MPRVTDIMLMQQMEQPTLTIRTRAAVQSLPQVIGQSYGLIAQYLAELNELVADVPFVCYHNLDMQNLDVEIGFPVPAALPAKGSVQPGRIPAGLTVSCVHRGPYAAMAPVYEEMSDWIDKNGFAATNIVYECYLNGPEFSQDELLTRIVMPVRKK